MLPESVRPVLIALLVLVATGCGTWQESFVPTETDRDPARRIPGVQFFEDRASHVPSTERVDYAHLPPTGGPHDLIWAACTGTVYEVAVRNENMVHSLEHGAVWIAYDPARISGEALQRLVVRVVGQPYTMLSPYPDLPAPISLQAWGHQLQLDEAEDSRIDHFLQALRSNPYTSPEAGSPCEAYPGAFDPVNPPKLGS